MPSFMVTWKKMSISLTPPVSCILSSHITCANFTSDALIRLGFHPSQADSSLFIYKYDSQVIYVLVYVDNILVVASQLSLAAKFIESLSKMFPVKNLGDLHFFLGIQVQRNTFGFFLNQSQYITDLLHRTNMHQSKPISTPMAMNIDITITDSPSFHDHALYKSVVSSLQYLSFTRPDISYAVNKVCQFMHAPKALHWQAVKRILRYPNSSIPLTLHLSSTGPPSLSAFCDVDWAVDHQDRRSIVAYCVYFGSSLIS